MRTKVTIIWLPVLASIPIERVTINVLYYYLRVISAPLGNATFVLCADSPLSKPKLTLDLQRRSPTLVCIHASALPQSPRAQPGKARVPDLRPGRFEALACWGQMKGWGRGGSTGRRSRTKSPAPFKDGLRPGAIHQPATIVRQSGHILCKLVARFSRCDFRSMAAAGAAKGLTSGDSGSRHFSFRCDPCGLRRRWRFPGEIATWRQRLWRTSEGEMLYALTSAASLNPSVASGLASLASATGTCASSHAERSFSSRATNAVCIA